MVFHMPASTPALQGFRWGVGGKGGAEGAHLANGLVAQYSSFRSHLEVKASGSPSSLSQMLIILHSPSCSQSPQGVHLLGQRPQRGAVTSKIKRGKTHPPCAHTYIKSSPAVLT